MARPAAIAAPNKDNRFIDGAFDSENGKAVMELLARVAQDPSRAVLAVTHDHRTLGYADRIIRIEDGRIVADERPNGKVPGGHSGSEAAA